LAIWVFGRIVARWRHGAVQVPQPDDLGRQMPIVWITTYRDRVLGGDVGKCCGALLRETARAHELVGHAGSINRDQVHTLLSIPTRLSVSRAVR